MTCMTCDPKLDERELAATAPAGLTIERIAVRADRLSLLVRIAPDCARYTTPAIARRLASARPTLPHHTCINDEGSTFGCVMAHTSVPHALEHAIIDEQVRLTAEEACSATDADGPHPSDAVPFVGTTVWLDEAVGLARVEVSFHDDLLALRALRTATALLRDCLSGPSNNDPER